MTASQELHDTAASRESGRTQEHIGGQERSGQQEETIVAGVFERSAYRHIRHSERLFFMRSSQDVERAEALQ